MASRIEYQPEVIEEFAGRLYSQAKWLVIKWAAGAWLISTLFAFQLLGQQAPGAVPIFVGLLGGALGAAIGRERGFTLRLRAQQALCQVRIERNTAPRS